MPTILNTRANYTLVGASVPPPINNFLTLYSVSNEVSKSKIITGLIQNWMESVEISEEALLDAIIKKIKTQRNRKARTMRRFDHEKFKNEIIEELSKKGLCEKHVNAIVKKLNLD